MFVVIECSFQFITVSYIVKLDCFDLIVMN